MKIKVSELEGEKLAEWTARAQEWFVIEIKDVAGTVVERVWAHDENMYIIEAKEYRPDINGGQAMELVKKFKLKVRPPWDMPLRHTEEWIAGKTRSNEQWGETPEIAICRATIASVYGEYVDE